MSSDRRTRSYYLPGGHNVICDKTGFKRKSNEVRTMWNGLVVWNKVYEPRHPQDLIRLRPERQAVRNPRPRQPDKFLGDNEVKAEDL